MRIFLRDCVVVMCLLALSAPSNAADGPEFFPANTRAIVTLNVKQLLTCPAIKSEMPKIREAMDDSPEYQFLRSTVNVDPLRDLDRVWLGLSDVNDEDDVLVVARGTFDRSKIKTLAEKATKEKKNTFKIQTFRTYQVYEAWLPEQVTPLFICFADAQTLLVSAKQKHVLDALDIHAGKKKSTLNKELAALVKKTNTRQTVSIAALGRAFSGAGGCGDKIENVQGGVVISDHFQADFVVTTKDVGSAMTIADEFRKGMKETVQLLNAFADDPEERSTLSELLEVLKVNAQGNKLTISARVNPELLKKVLTFNNED